LNSSEIPVHTELDIDGLRKSARIASRVLWEMINKIRPGVSPRILDDYAGKMFKQLKARSAPRMEGFPGNTCISVNEVVAHGVPTRRALQCGDRINIDVSTEHNGYFGDVAYTLIVGNTKNESNKLLDCAKQATLEAIKMSVHGTPANQVGRAIEDFAKSRKFTIVRNLCSHGVGKSLHAFPQNVLNYHDPEDTLILQEGMVIAWEPYLSNGACRAIEQDESEWNLTTHDKSEVAQFEHTVLVTKEKPEILTLLE